MAKRLRNNAAQSLSTERLHPSLQASLVPLPREGVALTPEQLRAIFGGDLRALHEAGDWVGRSELATKLNKNALNKWDVVLLGKLSDAGLIEMRQIPHHGPIGYEWQYRAIPNTQR